MNTQTESNVVRPLEWWQVIELETQRRLDRMREAEKRHRVERGIARLQECADAA